MRQKAGRNRSILDVGWHELRRQLGYKCERTGAKMLAAEPRNTSLVCTQCGAVARDNRVSQDGLSV